ncbi:hypothetical protein [Halomarina oriensis]|uniref:Right-handed parallel beta-helix repeat-containing protein n=1 Tax=Halomarina oriensis TaxID=671145 RepID=A0A6B0GM67_9EURY|nr:hypothetical protein [Halomarina oriensis]MWG33843.1 hypothetical protein [Halomarina oriensis]
MTRDDRHVARGTERESNDTDDERSPMPVDRRSYLRLAGAAVAGAGLLTAPDVAAAATEYHGFTFSTTVDMVEDAGCDPTGGTDCSTIIEDAAADDTLLVFPEGEYRIANPVVLDGYTTVGVRGEGEATFAWDSGFDRNKSFAVEATDEFYYEGIDWDITAKNCAPGLYFEVDSRAHVEDLEVVGRGDGTANALNPFVRDPDGTAVIRNFVAKQGSDWDETGRVGALVFRESENVPRNVGTIRFEDCHMEEFENNGIYAAASGGPIQVVGGTYRNNNRASLRFSGPESFVEDAVVEADLSTVDPDSNATTTDNPVNLRPIWWQNSFGRNGGEIRDTEVVVAEGTNSAGGVVFRRQSGACTVRDTSIEIRADETPAVLGQRPDRDVFDPPFGITLDDVRITHTGDAGGFTLVETVGFFVNRDGTEITDSCLHATESGMNGLTYRDSTDCSITDTTIDVPGEQVVEEDAPVTTTDVNDDGPCPGGRGGKSGERPGKGPGGN